MERGVNAFHIYTLNRAELAEAVCRVCGVFPEGDVTAAIVPEEAPRRQAAL